MGLRCLVVDDNSINLEIIRRMLAKYCTAFIEFTEVTPSGRLALQALSEKVYDLVLMDIEMPELTGIQTTRVIRSFDDSFPSVIHANRNIPIIAVTTNSSPICHVMYTSVGMDGCIAKPVTKGALNTAISEIFARVRFP